MNRTSKSIPSDGKTFAIHSNRWLRYGEGML